MTTNKSPFDPTPEDNSDQCQLYEELLLRDANERTSAERDALARHLEQCQRCRASAAEYAVVDNALHSFLACRTSDENAISLVEIQLKAEHTRVNGESLDTAPIDRLSESLALEQIEGVYGPLERTEHLLIAHSNGQGYVLDTLNMIDQPTWTEDPAYAQEITTILTTAYAYLKNGAGNIDNYASAYRTMRPFAKKSMSLRQRLRTQYVLAMAQAAIGDYEAALDEVADALELARQIGASRTFAELAYLQGAIYEQRHSPQLALRDFKSSKLHLLSAEEVVQYPIDNKLMFNVSVKIATQQFLLAQDEAAMLQLAEAQLLLDTGEIAPDDVGPKAWIDSMLLRWHGEVSKALDSALAATEVYTRKQRPMPLALIQSLTANIAMDGADEFQHDVAPQDRHLLLEETRPFIASAMENAAKEDNHSVQGVTLLANARFSRLIGANEDRLPDLESVINTARNTDDMPLLGQGYSALGDELLARGERQQAVNVYRRAVEALSLCEAPVWAVWPYRRLLTLSEMDASFKRGW